MTSSKTGSVALSTAVQVLIERWNIKSTSTAQQATKEVDLEVSHEVPNFFFDPELWKDLPDELLEHIRSKLPFTSLVKFLVVCKSWMLAILSSNPLVPNNRKCRSRGVVLQLCNYPITAFNSGKWEVLPKVPGPAGSLKVVASGGGLLCMRSNVERELVVWNPVTRRVRHLQIPYIIEHGFCNDVIRRISCLDITESYYRIGLVYNSKENCYRIIVAVVLNGLPGVTLVYNSGTRRWKRVQAIPQGFSFFLNTIATEDAFFCAVHSDERMFLEYNVHLEIWTAKVMPRTISVPRSLITIRGEVMLLTEIRQAHLKVDKLFVYQLTGSTGTVEDFLPQEFVREVFKAANSGPQSSIAEVQGLVDGDAAFFVALSMGPDNGWLRLRRDSIFMRIWTRHLNGEVLDSDWSCIGLKPENIDWAYSCRLMRSEYSRLSFLLIVPSLTSQP